MCLFNKSISVLSEILIIKYNKLWNCVQHNFFVCYTHIMSISALSFIVVQHNFKAEILIIKNNKQRNCVQQQ